MPVAAFLVAAVLVAAALPVARGVEGLAETPTLLVATLLGPPAAFLGGPGVDRVVVLVTLLVACDFGREAVERLSPLDRRVLGRD